MNNIKVLETIIKLVEYLNELKMNAFNAPIMAKLSVIFISKLSCQRIIMKTMIKLLWNATELAYLVIGFVTFSFCFVSNEASFTQLFRTQCCVFGLLMLLIGCGLDHLKKIFI